MGAILVLYVRTGNLTVRTGTDIYNIQYIQVLCSLLQVLVVYTGIQGGAIHGYTILLYTVMYITGDIHCTVHCTVRIFVYIHNKF